jgi:ParB family chromosome partitioning protein
MTAKTTKPKKAAAVKTKTATPTDNAFAGAADGLGAGIDALFAADGKAEAFEVMVNLDDIEVEDQERKEFEDEEHPLADLGRSLRVRQIQALVLRPNRPGREKPYLLVAGERRYRAGLLEGLTELRARVEDMTDEEAEDARFAENVHRKNLTQIEEAKRIQRDLDRLGSVDAVLEKHHKSRAWLSKILALLTLPEQAKRLVTENIAADLEVINTVKIIEKTDPEKAKELVDDLKQTRGKANAREKAAAVKEKVKPSKKPKAGKTEAAPKQPEGQRERFNERAGDSENIAGPKDRSQEEPGPVQVFAGANSDDAGAELDRGGVASSPADVLKQVYSNICEFGADPHTVLNVMAGADKDSVDAWLHSFYDAGVQAKDAGQAVLYGFRNGQFATEGEKAFALVAFLHGVDSGEKFSLLNVIGSVKP